MRILALESSCDESAAAFLEVRSGSVRRLEHLVASQAIHSLYGGVVPEVAAREHSAAVPPLLAGLAKLVVGAPDGKKLSRLVDVIAVTRGPGLVTSLRVGMDSARALAAAWDKKIVGINHVAGHVCANWLPREIGEPLPADRGIFPAVALVVSGGHTEILHLRGHGKYELLGATRDDAAGEAFDKTAKLLGLGYPGGPAISRLAAEGNPLKYDFPRPMIADPHLDLSFSGLKTAVRYFLQKNQDRLAEPQFVRDVAASLEQSIVEVLITKTVRAAAQRRTKSVLLAGGVAANGFLRRKLSEAVAAKLPSVRFVEPQIRYCTDNAAMIAMAAYFQATGARRGAWKNMEADPNWELGR